jgi:hypothetical protein
LKLNGTHQLLVYANDVSILGGSIQTIKKNTEAVVVAIKEIVLEANVDKTRTWSCLEIRMQDDVRIKRLIRVPLKEWNSSDIWEQP